ncbi:hypothetical protein VTK73DRAFT_4070 [Phialemonium thermophilum]|uniref:Uncharacterized protein n=1 Tax=Phialemonium thermophilum TaxID=223376 RepID=A0ABR3VDM2_9PEZI
MDRRRKKRWGLGSNKVRLIVQRNHKKKKKKKGKKKGEKVEETTARSCCINRSWHASKRQSSQSNSVDQPGPADAASAEGPAWRQLSRSGPGDLSFYCSVANRIDSPTKTRKKKRRQSKEVFTENDWYVAKRTDHYLSSSRPAQYAPSAAVG